MDAGVTAGSSCGRATDATELSRQARFKSGPQPNESCVASLRLAQLCKRQVALLDKLLSELGSSWAAANKEGLAAATKLVNLRIQLLFMDQPVWGVLTPYKVVHRALENKLSQQLPSQLQAIQAVLQAMSVLYRELSVCVAELAQLIEQTYNLGGLALCADPYLFPTTSHPLFEQCVEEVLAMYRKELFLKAGLVSSLSVECQDRSEQEAYLTAWQLQPYLDFSSLSKLQSLFQSK
eukprot:gb/GEZN01015842.1/.p1 GENE.gb/GEZN01015842.1/~~gb/GEZN01015842.1/.p1  ORF type:complete len:236 (-),score=52.42 gb/GEZN01015842.1/:127-834(-)